MPNTGISSSGVANAVAVALPLLAHVAQRVLRAALVELVEDHDVGEVEHVDLLELRRRAELRRHHVQRDVDDVDDLGVALADAGGLDDDQVEAGRLQHARPRRATRVDSARCARRVASERM